MTKIKKFFLFFLFIFSALFINFANINLFTKSENLEHQDKNLRNDIDKPEFKSVSTSNITDNSVDISWEIIGKTDLTLNWIQVWDSSGKVIDELGTDLKGTKTISNLATNTVYKDWKLVSEQDGNWTSIEFEKEIETFVVGDFSPPKINYTTMNNITKTSVDFNYNIKDESNAVTSVSLKGKDVDLDLGDKLVSTININNLTPNTEYSDWKLLVEYNYGPIEFINHQVDNFNTEPFQIPNVNKVSITNITQTSVDFSWNIEDLDNLITRIQLIGTDVDLDLGLNLSGEKKIIGLNPNIEYNDWNLVITYNDGSIQTINNQIEIFTTDALKAPAIVNTSVFDIDKKSVNFNWEINDLDKSLVSIKLIGLDVDLDLGTNLNGTKIINNLVPNTEYSDWNLNLVYNDGANLKTVSQKINAFTTAPFEVPVIGDASISNITKTSVDFNWDITDADEIVTNIELVGQDVDLNLGQTLSGSKMISDLKPKFEYDNWSLLVTYNDGLVQTLEQKIISFRTNSLDAPIIVDASISNITKNSVDFSWNINSLDNNTTSIKLIGKDVNLDLKTTLSGTKTINNLSANTVYSDWKLAATYNDGAGQQLIIKDIDSFTTSSLLEPIIIDASISNLTKTSVDFSWDVKDLDEVIISIELIGTNVNLNLGTTLKGTKTINGLNPNTEYSDWLFIVTYNNGSIATIKQEINLFATSPLVVPRIVNASISNITKNSVDFSWNVADEDNIVQDIVLSGTGINSDLNLDLEGTTTIEHLNPNTEYNDWVLSVIYNDGTVNTTSQNIDSFTTSALAKPKVNTSITNITKTSVDFSWEVIDTDFTIKSITLIGNGVNFNLKTSLSGSLNIDHLVANTKYDNWILSIDYNDGLNQKFNSKVDSFTTGISLGAPIIEHALISNINTNQVDFSWNINDTNNLISTIKLSGTDVNLNLGNQLSGTITIDQLRANTKYEDWTLIIEYNNGTTRVINYSIGSFTTKAEEKVNNFPSIILYAGIGIVLFILLIIILIIVYIKKKKAKTRLIKK